VTGAILLAAYAAATGIWAPPLLRRDWAAHAPRLAIAAWLALGASCVVAAALASVALAVPVTLSWTGSGMTGAGHAAQGGPATVAAGLVLAAAILARTGWCLTRASARNRRERREHAAFLAAAGRADHALGAVVLDQEAPAAYCLPGGPGPVVSAGTLAVLRPGQLHAVLAHERAHLRGHHHAVLTWAGALGRAFWVVPLLAQAATQIGALAEMAADDAAVRSYPADDLAAALVVLARAGTRAAALTAAGDGKGPAAIARVQRLLAPSAPRPARLAAAILALLPPALIACLPLLAAACDVTPHR